MVIEELVRAVLGELRKIAHTETVIGEPRNIGEITLIPVTRITLGFAIGGGDKGERHGKGEATGGGAAVEPIAFFVIRGEKVELITVKKDGAVLSSVMDLVPQILEKFRTQKEKKSASKSRKGSK